MINKWREPCSRKRRLVTTPTAAEWYALLNYWEITNPFPGYIPQEYPGIPMINNAYKLMLKEAQEYLGNAYAWGGKQPPNFDCSGYVGYLYKKYNLIPQDIISYTGTLFDYVSEYKVDEEDALPGDWVFWGIGDPPTAWASNAHVAIYIGNGYILDSASKGVDYRFVSYHGTVAKFMGYYHVPSNVPDILGV